MQKALVAKVIRELKPFLDFFQKLATDRCRNRPLGMEL